MQSDKVDWKLFRGDEGGDNELMKSSKSVLNFARHFASNDLQVGML